MVQKWVFLLFVRGEFIVYRILMYFFLGWCMVFNATFNNISVISGQSVLLVEKTTDLSQVTNK
jgi:hypothetical protein